MSNPSRLDQLTQRFGLGEQLTFAAGPSGDLVIVSSHLCDAKMALQGAQVFQWIPANEQPVIWLSEKAVFAHGKALRGGIPVCWPWFGDHSHGPDYPAHGFARTSDWEIVSSGQSPDGRIRLQLELEVKPEIPEWWPHSCRVELGVTFGRRLELELSTTNTGSEPFPLSEALHTYFQVSDIRNVCIKGLENCAYLDKLAGYASRKQQGEISIAEEVDRIYINSPMQCSIEDSGWGRTILIRQQEGSTTVVWNPWASKSQTMQDMDAEGYRSMLCVESGNAADNTLEIPPGRKHRLKVEYSLDNQGNGHG